MALLSDDNARYFINVTNPTSKTNTLAKHSGRFNMFKIVFKACECPTTTSY